jgi:branched-chain amino acid aminotransferase
MGLAWINGKLCDESEPTLSIKDAGFLHAAGVFTTMRAYNGRVFAIERHLKRLRDSCQALSIPLSFDDPTLTAAADELLKSNKLSNARLRLTVTRGLVRHIPLHGMVMAPNAILTAVELEPYPAWLYERGMTVVVVDEQKLNPYDCQAGYKTLDYFSRLMELSDANEHKANEALWFNVHNYLQSGSISNVFLVSGDKILTPPTAVELRDPALAQACPYPRSNVLPGVTRAIVLEIAQAAGITVQLTALSVTQLLEADEVFLTNSVMEVMPVTHVERRAIGQGRPGKITMQLAEAYQKLVTSGKP